MKLFFQRYVNLIPLACIIVIKKGGNAAVRGNLTVYERRENIKALLMKERFATAMRLAYLFDVDKQTIRRDIAFLSSRMPIVTKAGNGGGIFLEMNFETPKQYLSTEEETLLLKLSETLICVCRESVRLLLLTSLMRQMYRHRQSIKKKRAVISEQICKRNMRQSGRQKLLYAY